MVSHLVHIMAMGLLADKSSRSAVQAEAERHWGRMKAGMTPTEKENVLYLKQTVEKVVTMLVKCRNLEMLQLAAGYLDALTQGEVMITEDPQPV